MFHYIGLSFKSLYLAEDAQNFVKQPVKQELHDQKFGVAIFNQSRIIFLVCRHSMSSGRCSGLRQGKCACASNWSQPSICQGSKLFFFDCLFN